MTGKIRTSLTTFTQDRSLVGLVLANIILAVAGSIFLVISIEPNESQVITRYTSYGVTNFYRGYWYELFGYVLLALFMAVGHSALAVKLVNADRRCLAKALLWLTLGMIGILVLIAQSISKIASLG